MADIHMYIHIYPYMYEHILTILLMATANNECFSKRFMAHTSHNKMGLVVGNRLFLLFLVSRIFRLDEHVHLLRALPHYGHF